jgi:hypothetical protein
MTLDCWRAVQEHAQHQCADILAAKRNMLWAARMICLACAHAVLAHAVLQHAHTAACCMTAVIAWPGDDMDTSEAEGSGVLDGELGEDDPGVAPGGLQHIEATLSYLPLPPAAPPAWLDRMRHWLPEEPTRKRAQESACCIIAVLKIRCTMTTSSSRSSRVLSEVWTACIAPGRPGCCCCGAGFVEPVELPDGSQAAVQAALTAAMGITVSCRGDSSCITGGNHCCNAEPKSHAAT